MENDTQSNLRVTPKTADGYQVGQSATDLVGFYGTTPVVQGADAIQGTITDDSGGTAALTNGITTITGTYNSVILADAVATLAAQLENIRAEMVLMGLIKGSA